MNSSKSKFNQKETKPSSAMYNYLNNDISELEGDSKSLQEYLKRVRNFHLDNQPTNAQIKARETD